MFGKKKLRSSQTGTDSYVTEMIRAVLENVLKLDRVYLTQVSLEYADSEDVNRGNDLWVLRYRVYTAHVRRVRAKVFFTSLSLTRLHGQEGILPVLPHAELELVLTNEARGFYSWDLLRISSERLRTTAEHPNFSMIFGKDSKLAQLSEELRLRGPSRFTSKE